MRQEEYLRKFMEELDDFSPEDKEQIREYFQEMICDRMENGETEEEILQAIGSPEEVAEKLRSEYAARTGEENRNRTGNGTLTGEQPAQEIRFLRVKAENTRIQVYTVKEGSVRVLYEPREGMDEIWTNEENGVFTFQQRMRKWWFFDGFRFGKNRGITVEIPESFHGNVELITKNAVIEIENPGALESLTVKTSNARITASHIQSERCWMETSNGRITVSGAAGGDFYARSSNGNIFLADGSFTGKTEIRTSNGAIEVSGAGGRDIFLQTSNGPVRGRLTGKISDYDIESKTSNASSTLPSRMRSEKGRSLKVFTSNGKISLDFTGNPCA